MPSTDSFMLWVDAVGGYRVCLGSEVTLGQPVPGVALDVPILGDISSRHARIRRDGEGYLIEAIRDVHVNGRKVDGVAALPDGCQVTLGESVRLAFSRPHALSGTARLDFLSRHRAQPSADAVLLMADACILGPSPSCHVLCRDWPREMVLYRHDNELFCRTPAPIEIDGVACDGRGPIGRASHIRGEDFSLTLEPIGE